MVAFANRGVPTIDYGNNIRQIAKDAGFSDAFSFPGFVPASTCPESWIERSPFWGQ